LCIDPHNVTIELPIKAVCRDRDDKDECSSIALSTDGLMDVVSEQAAG
jgi:hypothetical protein